jgi:hypothetical protein
LASRNKGSDPVSSIEYRAFQRGGYVVSSITGSGSMAPTARKRGHRALIVIAAAAVGYTLTLAAILQLS